MNSILLDDNDVYFKICYNFILRIEIEFDHKTTLYGLKSLQIATYDKIRVFFLKRIESVKKNN